MSRDARRNLWVTLAAAAALCACPAAALGGQGPALGSKTLYGKFGAGWGKAHPRTIYNGGSPGGLAVHIRWRDWGAPVARGMGCIAAYRPRGNYYAKRVQIKFRASRIGRCPGSKRRAYTRLIARAQIRPGGPWGDWFPWALDLCDRRAKAAPCESVAFSPEDGPSEDGAFEITAFDVDCGTAQAVARESNAIALDLGPHERGYAKYRFVSSGGFVCNGVSFDDETLPSISWTCSRETAIVSFKA